MNGPMYNQLLMFHTIVAEGSISGAARKMEMAPPSVSRALKTLEAQLGLPLFTRTTRQMDLTEAGQLLYVRTQDAMSKLTIAVESVSELSNDPSGKVRITTPRFVSQYLIQPVYADFCRMYPNIELEISVSDASVNIISEGYDLGIRFGDRVEEGMVARPLTKPMKETLFASPEYIRQFGAPKTPEDLKQHKLIQYRFITANQLAPLKLDNQGEVLTVGMPTAMVVNDTDLMMDAARKGLGIGRIVEPMVEKQFADGSLIPVLQDYWYPYPPLYVYFHRNTQKAKRIRVFIDFLLNKVNTV